MAGAGMKKGLGLRPAPDPRDADFPIRFRAPVARRKTRRWAYFQAPLDQGNTGTCVGHAAKHLLMAGPTIQAQQHGGGEEPSAINLYLEFVKHDPWPQNDAGDLQFGTSMNAMGRGLRDLGYLEAWEHGWTVDAAADFLAGVDESGEYIGGPIAFGIPWTTGMFETDEAGFIRPTGRVVGGHAVACFLWNESKGEFWGPNSWGNAFGKPHPKRGQDGYWRMTGEDMQTLLDKGGEFVAFREERVEGTPSTKGEDTVAQQYHVAKLFAHGEKTFTNAPDDLAAVKKLPRDVRDHHIGRGNLIEWDDRVTETPPATETKPTPKKES